jgi:hypothetical protein
MALSNQVKLTNLPISQLPSIPEPKIEQIALHALDNWLLSDDLSLSHTSGYFFSTIGCKNILNGNASVLIDQNEVGLLLCFIQSINDKISLEASVFCSLKFEPGNVPLYQLSPSIQKTYSNIKGIHGGAKFDLGFYSSFITHEYYCSLLTEQSNSFLHKKNLNVAYSVNNKFRADYLSENPMSVEILIRDLIAYSLLDNCIHIDLRSSMCAYLCQLFCITNKVASSRFHYDQSLHLFSRLAFEKQIPWRFLKISEFSVYDELAIINKATPPGIVQKVVGVRVETQGREVLYWSQPLIECSSTTFDLFFFHSTNSLQILSYANVGVGSRNEIELMPYIFDCEYSRSSLATYLSAKLVHSSLQSEEGGRFYRRFNKHNLYSCSSAEINHTIDGQQLLWLDVKFVLFMLKSTQHISIELRSSLYLLFSYLLKDL